MGLMGASGISDRKIIDLIYPVGSIYISANAVSPATLFGGSWEQIQGRFMLTSGNGYSLGATGGSANHGHSLNNGRADITFDNGYLYIRYLNEGFRANSWTSIASGTIDNYTTKSSVLLHGSTDNASSMPPYIVVNAWKRTA